MGVLSEAYHTAESYTLLYRLLRSPRGASCPSLDAMYSNRSLMF